MRHPSERFIKSLIVREKTNDEIQDLLIECGLPPIVQEHRDAYLTHLSNEMDIPKDLDLYNASGVKYLKEQDIYYLVHPDAMVASCTRVLDCAAARRDIFVSLLGRMPTEDVADHLNDTFDLEITDQTIRALGHYYFDVNLLSYDEWAALLPTIPNGTQEYYESVLHGGAAVAAYRLGKEQHISVREAIQSAIAGLYVSLQEVKHWPASPMKIKVLSDTVSALAKAHNVITTADAELASVAQELRQFKLAKNAKRPVSLKMLAGTSYSHSGEEHEKAG